MINQRILRFSIFAAALLALYLPAVAAAQWDRYPDYGRSRDRDNGRYGRYDDRYLRDSIHRLDRLSKNFESALDRELDRSHEDGTRHEDRVNNEVHDFRRAVGDLKSRFGNGRDLNRSRNEAQRVLQTARGAERASRHHFRNGQLANQWSQIRQELNVIAQAYGSYGYNDDNYRNDRNRRSSNNDWWRRLPIPY
ncbi:MAG: hypothetical protein H0T77_00925 [Pyrinomonadaceae bacterium]|nr:hypothetical protein [Pyrinomonadaceae bacterium]